MMPFQPMGPGKVFATPGTTSSAAQAIELFGPTTAVRIHNGTNQIVGVSFGGSTVTASLAAGSFVTTLPAGGVAVIRVPAGATHAAVIAAAASTGSVYLRTGEGLS